MSDIQNAGFNFIGSTGADASIFGTTQLADAFGVVKSKLQQAANNPVIFTEVFGDKANTPEFQSVIGQWKAFLANYQPSKLFLPPT